jgi:MoaA/NifB/PqqE/SkfB family radical SAM enzyme
MNLQNELGYNDFAKIISQFPVLSKVILQGLGEPFMQRDFAKMVKFVRNRGAVVSTVSNCTLVTDRTIQSILESGLEEIWISVDGANKGTFERMRPGSNFNIVKDNLTRLAKSCLKNSVKIGITVVATTINIHELVRIVDLGAELGIPNMFIQEVQFKFDPSLRSINPTVQIPETAHSMYQQVRDRAKEHSISLESVTYCGRTRRNSCSAPWGYLYITCEGDVTPCCCIFDVILGNVLKEDISQIWNNSRYIEFRRQLKDGPINQSCVDCIYL